MNDWSSDIKCVTLVYFIVFETSGLYDYAIPILIAFFIIFWYNIRK